MATRIPMRAAAVLAAAVVLSAGCGGDDSDTATEPTAPVDAPEAPAPEQTTEPAPPPESPGLVAACPSVGDMAAAVDPSIAHGDEYIIGDAEDLVCEYLVGPTDEAPVISMSIETDTPEAASAPAAAEVRDGPGDWAAVQEDGSVLVAVGGDLVRVRMSPGPEQAIAAAELVVGQ